MASRPRPFSLLASALRPSVCATWLLLGSLLIGCGRAVSTGGEPGAETPNSAATRDKSAEGTPETLEQAEAELEQARLALAQVGGGLSAPAGAPAAAAAPTPAPPPSPASAGNEKRRATADEAPSAPKATRGSSRAEESSDHAESEEGAAPRDDDRCETTCKAYASLVRAKSAVCRLDTPGGARCTRAEGIVRDATPQVQSCHCSP